MALESKRQLTRRKGAPLDAWAQERGGCLDGTGSEDAQFSNGNTEDGACNNLEQAAWAYEGVRVSLAIPKPVVSRPGCATNVL